MLDKNIYFYFKDAKTGKEIPKEIVDTLFLIAICFIVIL